MKESIKVKELNSMLNKVEAMSKQVTRIKQRNDLSSDDKYMALKVGQELHTLNQYIKIWLFQI
jgi:hypothetical protein